MAHSLVISGGAKQWHKLWSSTKKRTEKQPTNQQTNYKTVVIANRPAIRSLKQFNIVREEMLCAHMYV